MPELKRTPFNDFHHQLGAKLVDFGGWEMPLQYSRIIPEHNAVRQGVGLFDVSHMGEVFFRGPKALDAVRHIVTNSVDLEDGQAQYTCMCNHDGGIIDDLIVYRLSSEEVLLCVNAANLEKDFSWLHRHNPHPNSVVVTNESSEYAQVALQGRHSVSILTELTKVNVDEIPYYGVRKGSVAGVDNCIIARTGYTGEDGFEIFLPAEASSAFWPDLMDAGKPYGLEPIGLGARDTLRLEARMHLYGNDMDESRTPYEASLGWSVNLEKGDFIGRDAMLNHKANQWKQRLVGLTMPSRIPRPHCDVLFNDQVVGEITSGTKSPSLGYGIALGYVPRKLSRPGTQVEIDIRGKTFPATVVKGPFYKRDY